MFFWASFLYQEEEEKIKFRDGFFELLRKYSNMHEIKQLLAASSRQAEKSTQTQKKKKMLDLNVCTEKASEMK